MRSACCAAGSKQNSSILKMEPGPVGDRAPAARFSAPRCRADCAAACPEQSTSYLTGRYCRMPPFLERFLPIFVSARDYGRHQTLVPASAVSEFPCCRASQEIKRRASITVFFQRPAPMWDQLIRLFRELPETSKLFI